MMVSSLVAALVIATLLTGACVSTTTSPGTPKVVSPPPVIICNCPMIPAESPPVTPSVPQNTSICHCP
jgi:hypothetical protein